MSKSPDFFQVGGTLSADAPSYIERPADSQLLAALERHQVCLVLGPRQMGKSSLIVHAIARLKEKGVTSAVVDLQLLGSETDFERWFVDVIYQIKRSARLKTDTKEWWDAHRDLGPTQRFMAFLEDVLLTEIVGDVVLFFDEIDSVLNLPFADDFFTTIRSVYNSRAINPELERLSIVLVGVATASSFVKDRTRTPFNIGESITLTDFAKDKTKPFQDVLGADSEPLVDRIFYWTNGQPLMVQKLAAAAYWWVDERTPKQVDTEVDQSYLRRRIEQDTHLKFTQDYLLDPATNVHKTLTTYRSVLKGEYVENNEQSSVHSRLKLAGVVRAKDGMLEPRNKIYQNVFNLKWVQEHQPVNFHKWMYGGGSALSLVLIGLVLFFMLHSAGSGGGTLGRPLRVGITSWPGYAGGLVANNGLDPNKNCIFWVNHELLVQFIVLQDSSSRSEAFAKGSKKGVDIVWSTVDYWANELPGFVNNGVKARAIMQVDWSRGGDAIVADGSIKNIEELKGKEISLVKFTPSHWLLEYHLENSSLSDYDQKQIIANLVFTDNTLNARQAFKDKQVDATVVWEPDVTLALERPGSHKLVSTETANNLIADVMVAREDFIKDHPDVIRAFIQGWLEGTSEAVRNPDKVAQLLMENEPLYGETKDPNKVKEILRTVKYADLADNTKMFGLDGSTPLFDQLFTTAGAAWVRRGYITSQVRPDQAKDVTFLKELYANSPIPRASEETLPPLSSDKTGGTSSKPVDILFTSGSSELSPEAKQAIDTNIVPLVWTNSHAYIRVSGNTDYTGSRAGNIALSKARAEEVVKYLVDKYHFNRNRFIVEGNGPDKPRAPNDTPEGQARNRRTDVEIIPVR